MSEKTTKTHAIAEAALLIALAQILSYLTLMRMPNGGSVDLAMLPIIIFASRWGLARGTGAGLVFGLLQYFLGGGLAIDWTTMIADYLLAFTLLGFGAGLFKGKKVGIFYGATLGCLLRFLTHLAVGALIWGKWMPDEFFGMTMTSPWFYSLLYNGSYMLIDYILVMIALAALYKPLGKYLKGGEPVS